MIEISLLLAVEDIVPGPKKVGLRFVVDHEDRGQRIIINAITRGRGLRRKFTIYYVQRRKHLKLDFTGVLTRYEPEAWTAKTLEHCAQALISVEGHAIWTS